VTDDEVAAAMAPVPKGKLFSDDDIAAMAARAEPAKPSLWERTKRTAGDIAGTVKRGAGAAIEGIRHPIDTATDPAKRRELERGLDDMLTLGYGQKVASWAGEKLGDKPEETLAATAAADAQAAPGFREAGNLAGMFTPGATQLASRAGGALVGKALGGIKPAGALAAAGLGAVKGAAGYEATAPALAAAAASSEGRRLEAAREAATDPTGLITAGVLGGAGEGAAKGVANTKGAKAAALVEEKGGGATVGPLSPGKGGVFDRELAGVPANDRGIGQASKIASKNILVQVAHEHQVETSRPYRVMKDLIDNSPAGQAPRDISPIIANMQSAAYDLETAPFARAALEGELKVLERYRDPVTGAVMVPERQLNGLRRTLMRTAKVGMTDAPGEAEAPLRAAAFEAKKLVDQGPYASLNQFYAEGAQKTADTRKGLGLKGKPAKDSAVDVRKLKLTLQRNLQNTETAGGDADLAAVRGANPAIDQQANLPALAKARADLAFRLAPQHGGIMSRVGHEFAGPAAAYGMLTHPLATAAAGAAVNAGPIAGRILRPLTRNIDAAQTGARGGALIRAAQEKRRRELEAAQQLMGGTP